MYTPYSITVRNVNEALPMAVKLFRHPEFVRRIAPRDPAKVTLELNSPMVTCYLRPLERVLFDPARDANPFFHFFESLWILAGDDRVDWLANFLPRMRDYSDNKFSFHGAYGHRMRSVNGFGDQLADVVLALRRDPDSRRAIVGIWQPDLDSGYDGKDMPCNCTIAFKLRDGRLHMSVFNRSNDMVWGAYGANVVQFSTLLEYVAAMLAVPVGTYYQWSDSFHVYEAEPAWQRIKECDLVRIDPYDYAPSMYAHTLRPSSVSSTYTRPVVPFPLVSNPATFDDELLKFHGKVPRLFEEANKDELMLINGFDNTYLDAVAVPLLNSFLLHKRGHATAAMAWAGECAAQDWRLAAQLWLHRRYNKEA